MKLGHRSFATGGALLWSLVLAGCGLRPTESEPTRIEEWEANLPAAIERTSEYQRRFISDGVITAPENERARAAYVDCLATVGLEVLAVAVDENGLIKSLACGGSTEPSEAAAQGEVEAECHNEFYSEIEAGWLATISMGDSDKSFLARVSRCLRGAGHHVPISPATGEELMLGAIESAHADFRRCAEAADTGP